MTNIDVNKTIELYDTRNGETFASSKWSDDNIHENSVWGLKVADMGRGRIACSYGHRYCAYAVFVNGAFDERASTDFQLAVGSMGIRNVPYFEDKPIYHQTFEQSGISVEPDGVGYSYSLKDSRGYNYRVWIDRTGGLRFIIAGCRMWDTFSEARSHYDENYGSDGNRHEVLKMLEVLEGWYTAICADKKPKPTLWELVKEKAPCYNWGSPFLVNLSTCAEEEEGSGDLRVVYDKNDYHIMMALSFGSEEPARWLTKEMATNLRDMLSEAIDDWGKNDDDDIPF